VKYRKRPIEIEARQYGWGGQNGREIASWAHEGCDPAMNAIILVASTYLEVRTLEGHMVANYGDWIIKGINGEFYPCKPDIFEKTYEQVEP
jgi:PhoPQ-activated pathogenicity-related protein